MADGLGEIWDAFGCSGVDPVEPRNGLAANFREVWQTSGSLGSMAVLKRYLRPWLQKGTMTLLDVAAGTGEAALELHAWAARRGTLLRLMLLDRRPELLAIARETTGVVPGVALAPGDPRRLPFDDGQFEVAICRMALRQFAPTEAALVLRELSRVSRRGWVAVDLERHPLACGAARLLAAAAGRRSVLRAYSAAEVRDLVRMAGVKAEVYRCFPFQLAVVAQRA